MITNDSVTTGIPGLDEALLGGLPRNHVYLIEGSPGAGKTTLALQFIYEGIRAEEKSLYITLSETSYELRAVARAHGWDDQAIDIAEITPVEAFLKPEDEYTIFHPEEVEMAATINVINERVQQAKPVRLVIDSLSELRLLSRDPVRYRRQVLALKQHFTKHQITVLLLDDRTTEGSDHQMHSVVHGVITLESLNREYGKTRRRLEIAKLRGASYLEGYHDYSIQTGGLVVFPRLTAADHLGQFKPESISSTIDSLDRLLGGGVDRGSATLVMGPSGVGKSTLVSKYAVAAIQRSEPVAIFTFDEGLTSFLARGDALGMNLTEHVREKRISIEQVNPAELSPGEFAYRVRKSVEENQTKLVIIDSLNGYLTAMPEEEFLSLQMHEVLTYLNQHGVVTFLILAQRGVLGTFHTTIDLSYLADSIILLRFFEAGGQVRRAISVVKKRGSAHELTIREYSIGLPDAVQIGEPLVQFRGVLTGSPEFIGDPEALSEQPG